MRLTKKGIDRICEEVDMNLISCNTETHYNDIEYNINRRVHMDNKALTPFVHEAIRRFFYKYDYINILRLSKTYKINLEDVEFYAGKMYKGQKIEFFGDQECEVKEWEN